MRKIKIGARYRHYKGEEYVILHLGRDSDTLDDVVVYQGQYSSDQFGENPIWVRPLSEFVEEVEVRGVLIKRFECVEENE